MLVLSTVAASDLSSKLDERENERCCLAVSCGWGSKEKEPKLNLCSKALSVIQKCGTSRKNRMMRKIGDGEVIENPTSP